MYGNPSLEDAKFGFVLKISRSESVQPWPGHLIPWPCQGLS